MIGALRTLRSRLALAGSLAIYLPVLVVFAVTSIVRTEVVELEAGEHLAQSRTAFAPSAWAVATVVALAPLAVALAWWWSGRAVRPLERSARVQQRLVEETSHELRTPLSVLVTNAEVLLAHPEPDLELYRAGLERSRSAAERMRETLAALLTDARGRARVIDRRPVDLASLARSVLEDVAAPAAARSVTLTPPAGRTACAVDAATVRRALANLVDNAVKHAPAGSAVEVVVARDASLVKVTVTDHGPGLGDAERERVFERFWRGGDVPGTGLGLPIARQIALAHGGELTVESPGPAGDGCRFTLALPVGPE